jgi:hypothetical protein
MIEDGDKKLIIGLAKEGLSASVIANKLCTTRLDVLCVCAEAGQEVKHYKKKDSSLERTVEILLRKEYSAHEIKRLTGIDRAFTRIVRAKVGFIGLPKSYIDRINKNKGKASMVDHLKSSGMTVRQACKNVGISAQVYYECKKITLTS